MLPGVGLGVVGGAGQVIPLAELLQAGPVGGWSGLRRGPPEEQPKRRIVGGQDSEQRPGRAGRVTGLGEGMRPDRASRRAVSTAS